MSPTGNAFTMRVLWRAPIALIMAFVETKLIDLNATNIPIQYRVERDDGANEAPELQK